MLAHDRARRGRGGVRPCEGSYEQLVELFWKIHNTTQVNRQGWDIGDKYRSAIFIHSDEQARIATDSRARAQKRFRTRIATQIEPAGTFYRAEEYQQRYLEKRGRASCVIPAPATEASSTAREA